MANSKEQGVRRYQKENLERTERELDKLYGETLSFLTDSFDPHLAGSQRAWEQYRAAECDAEASAYEFARDSALAPFVKPSCLERMAKERMREVRYVFPIMGD